MTDREEKLRAESIKMERLIHEILASPKASTEEYLRWAKKAPHEPSWASLMDGLPSAWLEHEIPPHPLYANPKLLEDARTAADAERREKTAAAELDRLIKDTPDKHPKRMRSKDDPKWPVVRAGTCHDCIDTTLVCVGGTDFVFHLKCPQCGGDHYFPKDRGPYPDCCRLG